MQIAGKITAIAFTTIGIVAVSCGSLDSDEQVGSDESPAPAGLAIAAAAPTSVPTPVPVPDATATPTLAEKIISDPTVVAAVPPTPEPSQAPTPPAVDEVPLYLARGWKTDFSKHSVPYSEIRSGGPPRDGIPPIDNPEFENVTDGGTGLADDVPVLSVEINGEAKAYPLSILIWHEIVNDEVGGVPVSVTYCPLCNTAIVFDRRVDGQLLDFGTSGNLRKSDLVMWDRQTESWWQQITGEAIVGSLTGTKLTFVPAPIVSWSEFRDSFPEGDVLSRDTGFARNYDRPPYAGYDSPNNRPFLFSGRTDNRLSPMERVVGLTIDDVAVAYPFELFESAPVVNDVIGGQDVTIFYASDTLSVFAGARGDNPRVGSTGVYDPNLDGRKLTFTVEGDRIVDEQTGSRWNILGEAIEGSLEGSKLDQIVHANHFWFAWQAFYPETEVRLEETFAAE